MLRLLGLFCLLISQSVFGIDISTLNDVLLKDPAPFNYDLHIKVIPGRSRDESVMICCHGYGGNYEIAKTIKATQAVSQHLVGFNFPDHDIKERSSNASKISFGSIKELLPVIYILKQIVVKGHASQISLYGFSAGGGAVVNVIGVLNSNEYDDELNKIGVNALSKQSILAALQNGIIILDSPLKSIEEIIGDKANNPDMQTMANQYKLNQLRPIDRLSKWQGLKLSVILYFQNPDEAVTNRDDKIFTDRLLQYNSKGKNIVLIKNEGGHCGYHASLWEAYRQLFSNDLKREPAHD